MFATLAFPRSFAISVAGTFKIEMPFSSNSSFTSELFIRRSPPFFTLSLNFAKEGLFITIQVVGWLTTGEAISFELTITMEWAVPPRTSAP